MFSESCSTEETAKLLQSKYQSEMTNDGFHFLSELRRWYNFWKDKVEHQQNQPYSFIQTLEFPDLDFFSKLMQVVADMSSYHPLDPRKERELRLIYKV